MKFVMGFSESDVNSVSNLVDSVIRLKDSK